MPQLPPNHYKTIFQSAYEKLNDAQREAVDTIEGPVLVVAGPGTGKTQVLTMRIANILLQTDTKPSSILALTFTESAATNMRERLAALIGPDAYYVQISTFHAFCAQVITNHLEYFPLNPNSQPITDLERFELLQGIVTDLPLRAVKPLNTPMFHVRSLMTNISAYKREGVTPEKLQELIQKQWQDPEEITSRTARSKLDKQQQQLLDQHLVYDEYQKRLRASGKYDFDDMLALTSEVLSREEVLLQEYQEQYLYLLVDEYQDTNAVQNNVTHLLASFWGEEANIFAVGDPHQSIYRFQGASLENVAQFIHWYPNAKLCTLTVGYRCSELVYGIAHEVIEKDTSLEALQDEKTGASQRLKAALSKELVTTKKIKNSVAIVRSPDQTALLVALVEKIKALLDSGVPASEIAILYTKNKHALDILPLLQKWSIPFYVEGGLDALKLTIVEQFSTLCSTILSIRSGEDASQLFFEICTYPWFSVDRVILFQLGRFAGKSRISMFDALSLSDETLLAELSLTSIDEIERIRALKNQLEEWGVLDFQMVFTTWLETVTQQSGLHLYLMSKTDEALEPLLGLYSVFAFVKQLNATNHELHLLDFMRSLEVLREQHVMIPVQSLSPSDTRIRLSTVHKAKGQEWDYVFLLHVIDGVWGNRRPPPSLPVPEHIVETTTTLERQTKEQLNQDDRRLFYVALTRAKERVELWHADSSELDGIVKPRVASIFLTELDHRDDIVRLEAVPKIEPLDLASKLTAPAPLSKDRGRFEAYLSIIVTEYPLSVTALNNYLRDPTKFLYQNLLALPAAKLPHLAFGTAIHAALELLHTDAKPALMLKRFDEQLEREVMTEAERKRRRERGHDVLKAYLNARADSNDLLWRAEYKVGYARQAAFLDDIRLTGRIDRLDWNDQTHKTVRVVDYKTGKSRSRNDLLVATETARAQLSERERSLAEGIQGSHQRQLLFYALLGQLDQSFEPSITMGSFDFVESVLDQGKLQEHTFTLEAEQVNELKKLIKIVMQEIRSLSFLDQIADLDL